MSPRDVINVIRLKPEELPRHPMKGKDAFVFYRRKKPNNKKYLTDRIIACDEVLCPTYEIARMYQDGPPDIEEAKNLIYADEMDDISKLFIDIREYYPKATLDNTEVILFIRADVAYSPELKMAHEEIALLALVDTAKADMAEFDYEIYQSLYPGLHQSRSDSRANQSGSALHG